MSLTSDLNSSLNLSDNTLYSADPPSMAVRSWPSCTYTLALPPESRYALAAKWIWSTVPAIWIIIGTIGNSLSGIVIFRRYRKLSSTAIYLLSLSFTDTVFLYNEPLKHWAQHVLGIDIRNYGNVCCKLLTFLTFASFHMSAWILVAVTVERVVGIAWPYKVKSLSTERNAVIIISCIVALVFAVDSHLLYGFEIRKNGVSSNTTECFAAYGAYTTFYIHHWFWIHFAFGFTVPFLSILIGNAVVIFGLRKMRSRQKQLHGSTANRKKTSNQCSSSQRPRTTRTLTVMLLLLNTIFFISQTPLAVFLVYLPYAEDDVNRLACSNITEYMAGAEKLQFWHSVTHSFAYMNAAINFVLYVISGSQFRRELAALLTCNTPSDKVDMNSRSQTSVVQENRLLMKQQNNQLLSTIDFTTDTVTSTSTHRDPSPVHIYPSNP